MGVLGIQTTSIAQNGLTHLLPPCTLLTLSYCDVSPSSRGLTNFLRSANHFPLLATRHPATQFVTAPKPNKHPVITASYINGRSKSICVRNMRVEEVKQKVELLLGNDGRKNRRVGARKVETGIVEGVGDGGGVRGRLECAAWGCEAGLGKEITLLEVSCSIGGRPWKFERNKSRDAR
ncbi:54S ribosomal protein L51, mitochondrial [Cyphellophora attinorum]|uniref:Large ribosomal subunit protein mL43 n=1 Tax=Cyphellophora attinorum TaxID=1664694 RepID=A0A0N1HLR9_9EURO|nr:54S ribosomal protein L51, mitochondrial [Phialophora attinorum]KPI38043.1 54S ribosomal protein L51, mitochondrial [Phialophora attinorum]